MILALGCILFFSEQAIAVAWPPSLAQVHADALKMGSQKPMIGVAHRFVPWNQLSHAGQVQRLLKVHARLERRKQLLLKGGNIMALHKVDRHLARIRKLSARVNASTTPVFIHGKKQ